VVQAYRELLEQLDQWFQFARDRYPGVIPCRPGCAACCHGPFDISAADVLLVRAGVQALPDEQQRAVRQRADALVTRMREEEPGWDGGAIGDIGEDRFDALADRLADVPCPCLDEDGACLIYQYRPLVCRTMGLSMETRGDRIIENACPIQDRFPAYATMAPQPFDLESLEAVELACLEGASVELFGSPLRGNYETTIAAAISFNE
jgi:Fe-S-cluster containining protein